MGWTDILNALREGGHIKDFGDGCDSETINRLLEHNVKQGEATQEPHDAGRQG